MRPSVMTINGFAFEFGSIEAEDGQKAAVKGMLEERAVEQPVPAVARVFHQHEETGEHCEEENAASCNDERVLNVRHRA